MKKTTSSIFFLFVVIITFAQKPLSLSQAIALGLTNNYQLKIQEKNQKKAQINNTWGNTSLMPKLTLNLITNKAFNNNNKEDYNSFTLNPQMALNWVFFDGFAAQISKKRFEQLEVQSKGNTALLVQTTIQDIIFAYNNCLLQKELMTEYQLMSQLSKDRMEREKGKKELGASTSYNYLQSKNAYLQDYSSFLKQKVVFENAIRTLNYTMGNQANETWNLSTKLSIDTVDYRYDLMEKKMFSNNQTLKNQYINQTLKQLAIRATYSDYYPTLSLNGNLHQHELSKRYSGITPDIDSHATELTVGLSLSWTLFNGGVRKRATQLAKIDAESEDVKIEQMKHVLRNQLTQLISSYDVNKQLVQLSLEQIETAKLNLEISKDKFEVGAINSFNYRDVQLNYLKAIVAHYTALFNLLKSDTELYQITGAILSFKQ